MKMQFIEVTKVLYPTDNIVHLLGAVLSFQKIYLEHSSPLWGKSNSASERETKPWFFPSDIFSISFLGDEALNGLE